MHSYYSAQHSRIVLQLRDLRGRGGQHLQRAVAQPAYAEPRAATTPAGVPHQPRRSTPSAARSTARRCSPNSRRSTHELAERTSRSRWTTSRAIYRELLAAYFGPGFRARRELNLECFRIPHFYRAFYVYKYATGMSAAIALAERVTNGGPGSWPTISTSSRAAAQGPAGPAPRGGGGHGTARAVDTALDQFAGWSTSWTDCFENHGRPPF